MAGKFGVTMLMLVSATRLGCTPNGNEAALESPSEEADVPSSEADAPSTADAQADSEADMTLNPDQDVSAAIPDDTQISEPDTETEVTEQPDTELDAESEPDRDAQQDAGPTTGPTQPEGQTCEGGDFYYPNITRRSDDGRFVLRIADVKPTSDALWTFTLQLFDSTGEWASGKTLTLRLAAEGTEDWEQTTATETTTPGVYETDLPLALPGADRWQLQAFVAGTTPSSVAFLFCNPEQDG